MGSNSTKNVEVDNKDSFMSGDVKYGVIPNDSPATLATLQDSPIIQSLYKEKTIHKKSHFIYTEFYIPGWLDENDVRYWNCQYIDILLLDKTVLGNMLSLLHAVDLAKGFEKKLSVTLLLFDYTFQNIHTLGDFEKLRMVVKDKLLELITKHHTIRSFENVYRLIFKDKDDLSSLDVSLKQRDEQKLLVKYDEKS
jgi:hypothetical protein